MIAAYEMIDGKFTERDSKAWRAVVEFAKRFPTGFEPEWDSFVIKHTAMQKKESETEWGKCIETQCKAATA